LCKYNRLMITSPRALLRGYAWLDTLSHEFVHYLVTRKGRNAVPIWLQEGLAKFLETRWRGAPGLAVDEMSTTLLTTAARDRKLFPQFEQDWRADLLKPRREPASQAPGSARPLASHKLVFKEDAKKKGAAGAEAAEERPNDPEAKRAVRLGEIFFARRRWAA